MLPSEMHVAANPSERRWLGLILAVYWVLAIAYSVVIPAFENPDEIHHAAYVDYVVRERRLPVAELGQGETEYHQPPLYYLAAAAFVGPLAALQKDVKPPYAAIQRNPFWGWRIDQVGVDNKNQFIHGADEALPFRGWALRLHLLRLFSIALETLTLLCTFLIGRDLFPDRPAIRLGSLAFVAFLPQFLFVSGSVSNDNLITPLAALTTWLLVRSLGEGLSVRRSLAIGLLTGLAVLTKMSGLVLLPLAIAVLVVTGWRNRQWRQTAWSVMIVVVLAVMLSAPVLLRNFSLYGEPTALRRMSEIWGQHVPPLSYGRALAESPNIWTSFWARFGYGQIPVPNIVYELLLVVATLSAVGLIIWLIREHRQLTPVLRWQLLLLVAIGGIFAFSVVSYVRVSLTGGNGRFAFPALPAYAIMLYLGLCGWLSRRRHMTLAFAANAGMAAFAIGALLFYLLPAYHIPASQRTVHTPPQPVELRFGDEMVLHGYGLDRKLVYPGDTLEVKLYWQGLAKMSKDYTVFVHLLGPNGDTVGGRDTYPGLGRLPTSQWQPGEHLVDAIQVPLRRDVAGMAPTALRLEVGVYDLHSGRRLPATDAAGNKVDFPVLGRLKLAAREQAPVAPSVRSEYHFGNELALLGYDLPASVRPGETLPFTLYWQALAAPSRDYTVFVHLVDPTGNIVAQADGPPLAGAYPTGLWTPPEQLADRRELTLPATLAPGVYRLHVGLYLRENGQRLAVVDDAGQPVADHVELPDVSVRDE